MSMKRINLFENDLISFRTVFSATEIIIGTYFAILAIIKKLL